MCFLSNFPVNSGAGSGSGAGGPGGPNSGPNGGNNNGGPGTPREDSGSGMGDYNLGGFGGPGENVSLNNFLFF